MEQIKYECLECGEQFIYRTSSARRGIMTTINVASPQRICPGCGSSADKHVRVERET